MDRNPGVLFFYLQWADEMFSRWMNHGAADAVSSLYMRTWVGALYAVAEGWRELELTDPVVDLLLAQRTGRKIPATKGSPERDERFVDLLRRARNDVFHFSGQHVPPKLRAFFEKGGAQAWAKNLHGAFRSYFERRAG
jgi:hypothetical protein